jgi:hypothetical protein
VHCLLRAASAAEQWEAYNKTVTAISDKLTFSIDRITFGNGKSLPLATVGEIPDHTTVWEKRTPPCSG